MKPFWNGVKTKKLKRRIAAVAMSVLILGTAIPTGFLQGGRVQADEVDVTDSSELSFDYSKFNFQLEVNGTKQTLSFNSTTNTYEWPSGLGVSQVTGFSAGLNFNIANERTEVHSGTYFTYEFPDVLAVNETAVPQSLNVDMSDGSEITLGTYTIENNLLTFHFTAEDLDQYGVTFNTSTISITGNIDKTKIGEDDLNLYEVSKSGSATPCYIQIPKVPTELSEITKTAEVLEDNTIRWTITLGSSTDSGVSLAGGTIIETLDGNQVWSKAYLGTEYNENTKLAFTQVAEDSDVYTYTFPEESTLTAPQVITVETTPKESVMSPTVDSSADSTEGVANVDITNHVSYVAMNKTEADALTADATAVLKYTTLNKEYTVIDGNTAEWVIDLNNNLANVYEATVIDSLTKGLTVDESNYGIHIIELADSDNNGEKETVEEVTLTSSASADSFSDGVSVSYAIEEAKGAQTLKVHFGTFHKEYKIVFRTAVSGTEFEGDASINNKANVEVKYPTGGTGTGPSITYGSPNVAMEFKNAHVAIEGTGTDTQTGKLSWKATPTTKMSASDYTGSTMTLTLDDNQSMWLGDGSSETSSVKIYDLEGNELTSGYSVSYSDRKLAINFDGTVGLNNVYVTFDTKAESYFCDDASHSYVMTADLSIKSSASAAAVASTKTAKQSLKNKMVTKTVTSSFDEENDEALFTFKIAVNGNELSLTNAVLKDSLSGVLRYTDLSNVDAKGGITTSSADTVLGDEDFEIRSVTTSAGTESFSGKDVTVSLGNLSTTAEVVITVALTSSGKEKLQLGNELSEKVLYANNSATVTATELDEDGITGSVAGTGAAQIAINKLFYKTGAQVKDGSSYTSDIQWVLDVNSMGASLNPSGNVNAKIVDTIPAGLTIDKTTLKVYEGTHGSTGTLVTGKGNALEENTDYTWSAVKQKDGTTILTIELSSSATATYQVVYTTAMSGGVATYTNSALLGVGTEGLTKTCSVKAQAYNSGSGAYRAFLTMKKTDALSSTIAVKGAKYGIFDSLEKASLPSTDSTKENAAVDVGYTDENGQIVFTVPGTKSSSYTYYVCELEAPIASDGNGGGYALDKSVYTISNVGFGKYTIGPNGIDDTNTFVDEREKDSETAVCDVDLTNTFLGDSTGGLSSSFQLYVCPTDDETENKAVSLTKTTDGEYKFEAFSNGTVIAGLESVSDGTNSTSNLKVTDLPWGKYKLVQTKTAAGYVKASAIYFTVAQGTEGCGVIEVPGEKTNVDNAKTVFTIKDTLDGTVSDYEYAISGTFVDETDPTKTIDTKITLSGEQLFSGVTYTGRLVEGENYTITETKVPAGYTKHADETVGKFKGNDSKTLSEKQIAATVVVKDQDGTVLSDDVISFVANDGTKISGAGLDLTGKVNIDSSYDITGTLTDKFLSIANAKVTVTVSADGTSFSADASDDSVMKASATGNEIIITVQRIKANVVIKEVSSDNKEKILTGGKFELLNKTTDEVVSSGIVDENGGLTLNDAEITGLEAGSYYLMQMSAPTSYTMIDPSKHYDFSVSASDHNKVIEITVENDPCPGTINVTKTSDNGTKTLAGAKYKLFTKDADGNEKMVGIETTNDEGQMSFTNLLWDTYYLKEVEAPAGYQLDTTVHGGWVIDETVVNQVLNETVSEEPTSVKIQTFGYDISGGNDEGETPALIGDSAYKITGIFAGDTEETTKEFEDTDDDGVINISNEFVLGNTYKVQQINVKSPYNLADDFEVNITTDIAAGTDGIKVENRQNRFALRLENEYGKALGGATFALYDEAGTLVRDDIVSVGSSNGQVDITNVTPGIYTIKQTTATDVDGLYYALDDSGITFELKADNTVEILSINDVATSLKAIDMAQNDTVAGKELGYANSTKIDDEAVIEYVNTPTVIVFDTSVRYNEDCSAVSGDTSSLTGITYGIYTDEECTEANHVANGTTDENGTIIIAGLPVGNYYAKMIKSDASNIVLDDTVYIANVTGYTFEGLQYANGSYVSEGVTLEVNRSDLTLTKTDKEDNATTLAGSTYGIYRKSSVGVTETTSYEASKTSFNLFELLGSRAVSVIQNITEKDASNTASSDEWVLVSTSVTDENGKITFSGVDVGVEYMIQEISESSGYQVSKDPILVKFVMQANGSVKLTALDNGFGTANIDENGNITWFAPRLKVAVRLVDEDGNVISGGQLQLVESSSSKEVGSWTTSSEDKLFSGKLTADTSYTVVQTQAADGYIAADNVTFTAEGKALSASDDYIQVITVVNKKEAAKANTEKSVTDQTDDGNTSDNDDSDSKDDDSNSKSDDSSQDETSSSGETDEKSPKTGETHFWDFLLD